MPETITLRLAVPGEGSVVTDLNARHMVEPSPEGFFLSPVAPEKAERWIARGRVVLAESDGRAVGMLACGPAATLKEGGHVLDYGWQGPRLPMLERVAVLPEFRRHGIAARMLGMAHPRRSLLSIVVTGPVPNRASLTWHLKRGFVPVGVFRGNRPGLPAGYASVLLLRPSAVSSR